MKGVAKELKFTIAEAAKKLGVTTKALYAAIKDGRLKANQEEITFSALVVSAADLKKYRVDSSRQWKFAFRQLDETRLSVVIRHWTWTIRHWTWTKTLRCTSRFWPILDA